MEVESNMELESNMEVVSAYLCAIGSTEVVECCNQLQDLINGQRSFIIGCHLIGRHFAHGKKKYLKITIKYNNIRYTQTLNESDRLSYDMLIAGIKQAPPANAPTVVAPAAV